MLVEYPAALGLAHATQCAGEAARSYRDAERVVSGVARLPDGKRDTCAGGYESVFRFVLLTEPRL